MFHGGEHVNDLRSDADTSFKLETCVGVGTKIIDVLAAMKHKKS